MVSINNQRNVDAGSYRCNYCGWTTWGKSGQKTHQFINHLGKKYSYKFFWVGPYNCYTYSNGKYWHK